MIRNFCIDCMITCAVFMIVWGCLPALLAQDSVAINPPFYEEDNLPENTVLKPNVNTCCNRFGDSAICIKNKDPASGLCRRTPSCNNVFQWGGCKCGSIATLRSVGPPKIYFVSCDCGG